MPSNLKKCIIFFFNTYLKDKYAISTKKPTKLRTNVIKLSTKVVRLVIVKRKDIKILLVLIKILKIFLN